MAGPKTQDVLPGTLGYDDFWSLPDDGNRYELIDGKLYVTPAPAIKHQLVSSRLHMILQQHVGSRGLGQVLFAPTAVILGPHRQVQPDLFFVERERRKLLTRRELAGPPDLAIEIVSPSTRKTDRVVKSAAYADSGIPWYWVVDPNDRTVEEYRHENGQCRLIHKGEESETFEPKVFPGLTVRLENLFDWSDFEGLDPEPA